MEIKRKFEMLVATNRRYIIRQTNTGDQMTCSKCGSAMLVAEKTAVLFGIKQRIIFQLIEKNAAHFTETEAGAVMACLSSIAESLDKKLAP